MTDASCSVDDCPRKRYGRGYCKAHYDRVAKHGDPQAWKPLRKLPAAKERDDIAARIKAKSVITLDGCFVWQGQRSEDGYGHISWRGRQWRAHRAIWTATVGPIPDGLTLDHLCRNRACVNVKHLEPVTQMVNAERGGGLQVAIASRRAITECKHGHEFTSDNTITLAGGRRLCRECNRRRWAEKSATINARRRQAGRDGRVVRDA